MESDHDWIGTSERRVDIEWDVMVWLLGHHPALAGSNDDPCARCGHGAHFHRLDDATNVSPVDPKALFRCIWPRPDGPAVKLCTCPDHQPMPRPI